MGRGFYRVSVPGTAIVCGVLSHVDYADCYRAVFRTTRLGAAEWDVDAVAQAFFGTDSPGRAGVIPVARRRLGLRSTGARGDVPPAWNDRIEVGKTKGNWSVANRSEHEIVFRVADHHVEWAFSLRVIDIETVRLVDAITVVQFHGWLGRLYFLPIRPFHRLIVPAHMRHVMRAVRTASARGNLADRAGPGLPLTVRSGVPPPGGR
jgi:hypothetical protein